MKNVIIKFLCGIIILASTPVSVQAVEKQKKIDIKKIYKRHCLKCHGVKGNGKGKGAKMIKSVKVTDFTAEKWGSDRTDEQIFDAIKHGPKAKTVKVHKKMKAFKSKFKDPQIKALVKYIRTFGKKSEKKSKDLKTKTSKNTNVKKSSKKNVSIKDGNESKAKMNPETKNEKKSE